MGQRLQVTWAQDTLRVLGTQAGNKLTRASPSNKNSLAAKISNTSSLVDFSPLAKPHRGHSGKSTHAGTWVCARLR